MYPYIRQKTLRLICCTLAVSLSLTSIAGASMMTKMGLDSGIESQSKVFPCTHHAAEESNSDMAMVSDKSMAGKSMSGKSGVDSHSGQADSCTMCALCTSLVPTLPVKFFYTTVIRCQGLPEPEGFVSVTNTRLDKPPSL